MAKTITTQKQLQDRLRSDFARITLELYKAKRADSETKEVSSMCAAELSYINTLRVATGESPFVMYVEVDAGGKIQIFEDIKRSLVSDS